MSRDKGILAKAIAGGFKGGTEALRQKDVLTEKFLWGDEEARQARQLNLERFGQQKELATHTSGLAVSAAQTTRKQKREEGISAVQQGLKAKMEAMGSDPKVIDEAVRLAGAGLSADIIQGTPGKPLTAEAIKQVAEAVETLMPDATPEEKLAAAGELEKKITAGTYGIQKAAAASKLGKEQAAKEAAVQKQVDKTVGNLSKSLISNPTQAVKQFEVLASNNPVGARKVLTQLEEQGGFGREIKAMKRILDQGVRDKEPTPLATAMPGRAETEAFGPGSGAVLPPVSTGSTRRKVVDTGRPVMAGALPTI
jgi:hypothetical protein